VASLVAFFNHNSEESIAYKNQMLTGMVSSSSTKQSNLDRNLALIASYAPKGKLLMDCQTGLYSTNFEVS